MKHQTLRTLREVAREFRNHPALLVARDSLYADEVARQNESVKRCLSPDASEPSAPSEKFEELLARLEQIVSDMETADLPLDKLLSSYEEGMRLVKACGDRLADAEQKVEILSRAVAPAEVKPGTLLEPSPAAEQSKEEIRLF
jgi:exodeoxyribonuclease VII small subunit